ncbi:MAG TPA: response regulator [Phycisphaerae bacterium]|nr:response regulator [Phycisphaerae bacterium]
MRTLVIDDEFVALSRLVAILEKIDACDAATSGEQGLEMFRKALWDRQPYDLVIIDINMPDANGLDLLVAFRREENRYCVPRSRKLIVSADSTAENVRAAKHGECDGFLVKPVRRAVLVEKLSALELLPA